MDNFLLLLYTLPPSMHTIHNRPPSTLSRLRQSPPHPTRRLICIQIKIIQMILLPKRPRPTCRTHRVTHRTKRPDPIRILIKLHQRLRRPGIPTRPPRAIQIIIRLPTHMPGIPKQQHRTDFAARKPTPPALQPTAPAHLTRARPIPKPPTPTPNDIPNHVRPLTVPAQHQLAIRAALRVGVDLRDAAGGAFGDGRAVVVGGGVGEVDVLVVAGVEGPADGAREGALPARVRLVPAFGEEDVHGGAGGLAGGERGSGGGGPGEGGAEGSERGEEEGGECCGLGHGCGMVGMGVSIRMAVGGWWVR